MTEHPPRRPPARPGATRFAQRGSARLAYEPASAPVDGHGDGHGDGHAHGPVVVLLHDLLADRTVLASLRDALARAEPAPYRALLPDARGHGASPAFAARRPTLADLAADVLAVLDDAALPRVHVVGHGLGGATALALARLAPGRVASLVLVAPDPVGLLAADPRPVAREAHAATAARYRAAAEMADKGQPDRALDLLLDAGWGPGWRDRLPRPRLGAVRRHAGALPPLLAALTADDPSPAELAAVTAPTLLVAGAAPAPIERFAADRLLAALPNVRLVHLPADGDPALPPPAERLAPLLLPFLAAPHGDRAESSRARALAEGGPPD